MRWGEMAVRLGLAAWVRNEKEPSGRVHGLAREERGRDEIGRRKPKRKRISERVPMARGPDRPAGWSGGLRGRGGLAQLTRPIGPDARKKSNGN
jgi:hypothetical protein